LAVSTQLTGLPTFCVKVPLPLVRKFVSPLYAADAVCDPADNPVFTYSAIPATSATGDVGVPSIVNVTVPVGTPLVNDSTSARNVTDSHPADGFTNDVICVSVPACAWVINAVSDPPPPLKFAFPEYTAEYSPSPALAVANPNVPSKLTKLVLNGTPYR